MALQLARSPLHYIILCSILSACSIPTPSAVKVLGGIEAPAAFPATVGLAVGALHRNSLVAGRCTGTWIRDDLLLTAGHCFLTEGFDAVIPFDLITPGANATQTFLFNGQAASIDGIVTFGQLHAALPLPMSQAIYIEPHYLANQQSYQTDVAVVRFPRGTVAAAKTAALATQAAVSGDAVSLVGFGETSDGDATSIPGSRRVGVNTVVPFDLATWHPYGLSADPNALTSMLRLNGQRGPVYANGAGAVGDGGDSGGPLYNSAGAIVATDELGGTIFTNSDYSGLYVNLVGQPEVATFLRAAMTDALGQPSDLSSFVKAGDAANP